MAVTSFQSSILKLLSEQRRAQAGTCVLTESGALFNGSAQELATELAQSSIVFHKGHIRGAWPQIR